MKNYENVKMKKLWKLYKENKITFIETPKLEELKKNATINVISLEEVDDD